MRFFKKLLGGTTKPESPKDSVGAASPTVVNQGDDDPALRNDPASISHAFVALTHADLSHSEKVGGEVAKFNRHCQPRLWSVQFKAKFVTFAVNAMDSGLPDATSVGPALESVGLKPPYSIVINTMKMSLDGGRTYSKVLAGFAYRDNEPKIILPRDDGCVPA